MKFYYNGELVRTSKNHVYTHAVINRVDGKVICLGCSSSKNGAEKIISKEVSRSERFIENYKRAINALNSGKSGYYWKEGRNTSFIHFNASDTIEVYKRRIKDNENAIERCNSFEIVELEMM